MPRKAKKKVHKMPPLSGLDKCIYWVLILLGLCVSFGVLFGTLFLRKQIAFADPAVAAEYGHISIAWFVPLFFYLIVAVFVLWEKYYVLDRYPLFGIKNFRYGPPAWPRVYPLFMKNKPFVWVSEKVKQRRKTTAVILLVLLLVCLMLYPLSLCGRDVLLEDGRIVEYNMFGAVVREYDQPQIEAVVFGLHRAGKSYGVSAHVELFTSDGKSYNFNAGSFRDGSQGEVHNWLLLMLQLKQTYRHIVSCEDLNRFDRMLQTGNYTETEVALLRQLFGFQ